MKLFEEVKQPLFKKNLEKVTKETYPMLQSLGICFMSYEELVAQLEFYDLEIDNLYYASEGLYRFWYIDGLVHAQMPSLSENQLEIFWGSGAIQQNKEMLNKLWNKKDYDGIFSILDSQFGFDVYFNLFEEIEESQRYSTFIRLYVSNEYGFSNIDKDKIRSIFALNKDKSFIDKLKIDEEGYVTIFRGMQDKSTPVNEAYSWTLDFNVAKRFALRYNSLDCHIYKARVKAEDIIDVLTFGRIGDRSEKEVLILPETLVDVENLGYYNLNSTFFNELSSGGITSLYQNFAHVVLDGKWFKKPDGIHGKRHIKRVLFLSLIMSHIDDLPDEDMKILIYASLYHDIGRKNDFEDEGHGMQSVLKRRKLNLSTSGLDKEDVKIMEFIMKYHSIRDEVGMSKIEQEHGIHDKERAIDLFKRFKDCDGLDRVRLGDLDGKYLRTKTGKKLELLAYQLLRNIE